ncbi:MAG: hypothetical protein J0I47_14330 [Sphingomonas sp.]|uniref:hypothetical protein n=1 Tax=Sphingomonas sp. TaxID=28214 RepID=UPI001AD13225|nr:hypothetical protein [Sphingomonas sp.]MBN8809395.1 hypothetical protein [Sphingomonas sp.]
MQIDDAVPREQAGEAIAIGKTEGAVGIAPDEVKWLLASALVRLGRDLGAGGRPLGNGA